MRYIRLFFKVAITVSLLVSSASAADKEFDSEQILSDLESKLKLSSEKLSRLKPAIDEKSAELNKSMHESVEKGFAHLHELSEKLDSVSKDAEKKAEEILNSEEMEKLKDYLGKIDEEAIKEMKDRVVADLSAILELTEAQVAKLKPILEDSYTQLNEIFTDLAKEGDKSWEGFKQQYEKFSGDLQEKLQDTLDKRQMEKLKKYNEENKVKVQKALYSV